MSAWFNYIATLKILVFGLLIGAALPAMFAVGIRLGAAAGVSGDAVTLRRSALTVLSYLSYALVAVAVTTGVLFVARDFIGDHTGWFILGARAK